MSRTSTSHEEHAMRFTIATVSSQAPHPALKISIWRLELMFTPPAEQEPTPCTWVQGQEVSNGGTLKLPSLRAEDHDRGSARGGRDRRHHQAMIIPFTAGILQDHSSSPPRWSWRGNPALSSRADAESCRASSRMWAPLPPQPAAGAERELCLAHRAPSCRCGKSFRIRP